MFIRNKSILFVESYSTHCGFCVFLFTTVDKVYLAQTIAGAASRRGDRLLRVTRDRQRGSHSDPQWQIIVYVHGMDKMYFSPQF